MKAIGATVADSQRPDQPGGRPTGFRVSSAMPSFCKPLTMNAFFLLQSTPCGCSGLYRLLETHRRARRGLPQASTPLGLLDATGSSPVKVGFVWRHLKQFRATSSPVRQTNEKTRMEVPGKFENRSALRTGSTAIAQRLARRRCSAIVRQDARTESRNFATSTLRRLLSPDSICAAESIATRPIRSRPRRAARR
jgi:hypothetical protein